MLKKLTLVNKADKFSLKGDCSMSVKRAEEILAMSDEERARLNVELFQRALKKAEEVPSERNQSLTFEVEEFVNRYCSFAGWAGQDGKGM